MIIFYTTASGNYAIRDQTGSSPFVRACCEELAKALGESIFLVKNVIYETYGMFLSFHRRFENSFTWIQYQIEDLGFQSRPLSDPEGRRKHGTQKVVVNRNDL